MCLSKGDLSKDKYREVIPDTKAVDIKGLNSGKECDKGHAGWGRVQVQGEVCLDEPFRELAEVGR